MVSFKLVEKLGGFCHGKSRMTETKRLITISSFECIMWLVVVLYIFFIFWNKNNKICQFWAKKEEEMVEFWIDFMDWFRINANIFYDLFVIFLKDIAYKYETKSSMKSFFICIIIHMDCELWLPIRKTFTKIMTIEVHLTHALCHFMLWFEISFGGRNF